MNQSNPESTRTRPPTSELPKRFTFEWTEYEYGPGANEFQDPEIIDVAREYCADIIEPQPGRVVEGPVLIWGYKHESCLYAIVGTPEECRAIRTEVIRMPDRHQYYLMRSVNLEQPNHPLGWEVLSKDTMDVWQPVEGQHLRPRTALAQEWLTEIGPAVARLTKQEHKLAAERRAFNSKPSLRDLPEPLNPSRAQPGFLPSVNDNDQLVQDVKRAEEQRDESARQRLANHHLARRDIPRWNLPRRFVHWLQAMSLFRQFGGDQAASKQNQQDLDRLVHLDHPADARDQVETQPNQRQNVDVAKIDQGLRKLHEKVLQANDLVRHLQQHPGQPVTLLQTIIEGRRAEIVPTLPSELRTVPRLTSGHRMRL